MYKIYKHTSKRSLELQTQQLLDDFGSNHVSPGAAAAYLGVSRQAVSKACRKGSLRAFKCFLDGRLTDIGIDCKSLENYKEMRDATGDRIPYGARAI